MSDLEALKRQIHAAFADVEYPGDGCLRRGNEGDEPFLLERDFAGKSDWRELDPSFLDQAPDGFATALCFFSDEAFRFYIPAYLIADLDSKLECSDPVFHLCFGLDSSSRSVKVNERRYGPRTWFDETSHRFAMFNPTQASAICAYLEYKALQDEFAATKIREALQSFWFRQRGDGA